MALQFNCPSCGQKTRAPEELLGKRARCPLCQQVITVPASSDVGSAPQPEPPPPPASGRSDNGMDAGGRPCPVCGEVIRADARRCRYCGEDLIRGGRDSNHDGRRVRITSPAATTSLVCGIVGLVIWCVPCLSLFALPLCITALVTGIASAKDVSNRGSAIAGIVLGAVGLVGGMLVVLIAIATHAR
jgi:hypothetical protein